MATCGQAVCWRQCWKQIAPWWRSGYGMGRHKLRANWMHRDNMRPQRGRETLWPHPTIPLDSAKQAGYSQSTAPIPLEGYLQPPTYHPQTRLSIAHKDLRHGTTKGGTPTWTGRSHQWLKPLKWRTPMYRSLCTVPCHKNLYIIPEYWKSPIENVWNALDRHVRQRILVPSNIQQLRTAIEEEWENIPQATIKWSTLCKGDVSHCMRQMVVIPVTDWFSDPRPYL
jgi:hypothetical protein